MSPPKIVLYQIFHTEEGRSEIHRDCIPVDNRDGEPGWYEMLPMLEQARRVDWQEDTWYGFVSWKFFDKSGVSLERVREVIASDPEADVALFTSFWPQLAVYRNTWTHGEKVHPGLIGAMETFLRSRGDTMDLARAVTDFDTSVTSNYVIAKPAYWRAWMEMADAYKAHVESGQDGGAGLERTPYGLSTFDMRAPVQERFASYLLLKGDFRVVRPDYVSETPMTGFSGRDTAATRALFRLCDRSKSRARRGGGAHLLAWMAGRTMLTQVLVPRSKLKLRLGSCLGLGRAVRPGGGPSTLRIGRGR